MGCDDAPMLCTTAVGEAMKEESSDVVDDFEKQQDLDLQR